MNALFYNVHTGLVEDWTGMGMADLNDRVLRTPLPPLQTFVDDPLRILRMVRFASKLEGFGYHPGAVDALRDHRARLHDAVESKLSRERVGTEVMGLLQGAHAVDRLEHLVGTLGYGRAVFQYDVSGAQLHRFRAGRWHPHALLAAVLHDLRDDREAAERVIKTSLKLSNAAATDVMAIHAAAMALEPFVADRAAISRVAVGMALRQTRVGAHWGAAALLAGDSNGTLRQWVAAEGLPEAVAARPLVDGRAIMSACQPMSDKRRFMGPLIEAGWAAQLAEGEPVPAAVLAAVVAHFHHLSSLESSMLE